MKILIFFINLFFFCDCWNFNYVVDFSSRNSLIKKNKVIINQNFKDKNKSLIFFTGGFSFIRPDIYSNFYHNLLHNNISIYTPYCMFNDREELMNLLYNSHNSTIVAGHSSGCSNAINFCMNNSHIDKLILLDPVDTFLFNESIELTNIKKLVFIIAGKTYNYSPETPSIPFIPFLGYKSLQKKIKIIKGEKYETIYEDRFGHSDILNIFWGNLMHNIKISVGFKYRNKTRIYEYHNWLSNKIDNIFNE